METASCIIIFLNVSFNKHAWISINIPVWHHLECRQMTERHLGLGEWFYCSYLSRISPEIPQTSWARAADQYQLAAASPLHSPLLQGSGVKKCTLFTTCTVVQGCNKSDCDIQIPFTLFSMMYFWETLWRKTYRDQGTDSCFILPWQRFWGGTHSSEKHAVPLLPELEHQFCCLPISLKKRLNMETWLKTLTQN